MAPLVADGQSAGRQFGRRDGRARLARRARRRQRQARLEGLQHRARQGRADRPATSSPSTPCDRGKDLGVKTWPPDAWKIGGGTVWGWISYDPETQTDLLRHRQSRPVESRAAARRQQVDRPAFSPATSTPARRAGSTRRPRTICSTTTTSTRSSCRHAGRRRGAPGAPPPGAQRLLLRDRPPHRPGAVAPTPYGYVNVYQGRRPQDRPADPRSPRRSPRQGRVTRNICPAAPGAKDWNPSAFSPRHRPRLHPAHQPLHGRGRDGGQLHRRHALRRRRREDVRRAGRQSRRVHRLGPGRRRAVWEIKEDLPLWSPALATAGGLVFYGTMDGWFKAVDARTGKLLWQFKAGSGIIGQPISYRGPDGRQYIAVVAGRRRLGRRDRRRQARPARPDRARSASSTRSRTCPTRPTAGGMLYVFALPR